MGSLDDLGVVFNPDEEVPEGHSRPTKSPRGLVGLLIRLSGGLIENETSANHWLVGFALFVFLLAAVIFWLAL